MSKNNSDLSGIKVLLLEGFARQSMAIMESLHKLGCYVTTYNNSKLDLGYLSHYPDKKIIGFWDRTDETKSAEALMEVLKKEHYDVTIPLTDFSATMLSKHKNETNPNLDTLWHKNCRSAYPPPEYHHYQKSKPNKAKGSIQSMLSKTV